MINNTLYTSTPLSKAVFRYFTHVEKAISKVSTKPGSVEAYIFGGCALHIHTNARGSSDIDAEFNSAKWLTGNDIIFNKRSEQYMDGKVRRTVVLDMQFTPVLGSLHEDYQDDAILLQRDMKESPLWLYVVTPEDLALSKLSRYGDQDRNDILTLLKQKKMTTDSFRKRTEEALVYYPGNTTGIASCMNQVIRMHEKK